MSSLIKNKAREIISNPQKSKELRKEIFKLRSAVSRGDKAADTVKIGSETYTIRFVDQNQKRK